MLLKKLYQAAVTAVSHNMIGHARASVRLQTVTLQLTRRPTSTECNRNEPNGNSLIKGQLRKAREHANDVTEHLLLWRHMQLEPGNRDRHLILVASQAESLTLVHQTSSGALEQVQ